jgi:NAD(P)H-nitrite reductase large subunit
MKYVIIGNSTAAVGCIEGIRTQDPKGEITVVSNEPYHTYGRPLISYLLCGKTTEEKMKYRPDDFYETNGCTTLFGKEAVKFDSDKKTVTLDDGTELSYDKLLVATGSRPFVPPMDGLDKVKQKFTFMTLDDAKNLDAAIGPDSDVLIIGAGLIGLKCAEGIHKKVHHITVVDLADRILPSILDEHGSELMAKHIESFGIELILSDSVKEFKPSKAILNNGKEISFDVVVIAVGVRPNIELFAEAGGKTNRGILIDTEGKTSIADVYAAGDCVVSHDISNGQDRILAILPNAYMQGYTAGINMAGGTSTFEQAIPLNAMGFEGLHIVTAGSYDGDEYITEENGNYKKLVTKDNLLKGFIIIGDVKRSGIYTSLIREQTPLDTIDFELIKEHPQLMAFNRDERSKMLGGAH